MAPPIIWYSAYGATGPNERSIYIFRTLPFRNSFIVRMISLINGWLTHDKHMQCALRLDVINCVTTGLMTMEDDDDNDGDSTPNSAFFFASLMGALSRTFVQCHCLEAFLVSLRWWAAVPWFAMQAKRTQRKREIHHLVCVELFIIMGFLWLTDSTCGGFIHERDDIRHISTWPGEWLHERSAYFILVLCGRRSRCNYERFALVKRTWSFSVIIVRHSTSTTWDRDGKRGEFTVSPRAREVKKRIEKKVRRLSKRVIVSIWYRPFPFFRYIFVSFAIFVSFDVKFSISSVFAMSFFCVCRCVPHIFRLICLIRIGLIIAQRYTSTRTAWRRLNPKHYGL